MFYNLVMFWSPILISFIFIILQVEVCIKKKFLFSILITIFYMIFTIFIILVVTSFELYVILVFICMFFWLISISLYFANRSNSKFN